MYVSVVACSCTCFQFLIDFSTLLSYGTAIYVSSDVLCFFSAHVPPMNNFNFHIF